jgi:hypothetical protein
MISEKSTSFVAGNLSAMLPIIIEKNMLGITAIKRLIAALAVFPVSWITIQVLIKKNRPLPVLEKNIAVAYNGAEIFFIVLSGRLELN